MLTPTYTYRYRHLLEQPEQASVRVSTSLMTDLKRMGLEAEDLGNSGDRKVTHREVLWTVQNLQDELQGLFGGLSVVDRSLLPVGVCGALRSRKVTWQMVL